MHQNNLIQKGPIQSTVYNRPSPLHPGPLSLYKWQSQTPQSPPNPSVKRVIRPSKFLSNTILPQEPQPTIWNPDPQTLQKTDLNKPHPNKYVKRRIRQMGPNPKALVQNKPGNTKTNYSYLVEENVYSHWIQENFYNHLVQGRCPQSHSQRQHQYLLGQKILNPLNKVPGQIQPVLDHTFKTNLDHTPPSMCTSFSNNPKAPPFIPNRQPQVWPAAWW